MNKVVAFLDILGFGDHSYTNVDEALEMINDYQTILNQKIVDNISHPPESYPNNLQEIAKQNIVDSFELLLPFSDSLFIQSSSPNDFVKQISSFLLDCFHYKSKNYSYPEDPSDPSKVTIKELITKSDKFQIYYKQYHWHPLLFRGGISYGETRAIDMQAIVDEKLTRIKNIAGKAIVKAVKKLEPLGKGPRLFCDIDFYDQLDEDTKSYCLEWQDKSFEILWPAFNFIKTNDLKSESYKIDELIRPVANFCKAYNHLSFGIHFWEFLRLVVCASTQFFKLHGEEKIAEDAISKSLKSVGLENIEGALKKSGKSNQMNKIEAENTTNKIMQCCVGMFITFLLVEIVASLWWYCGISNNDAIFLIITGFFISLGLGTILTWWINEMLKKDIKNRYHDVVQKHEDLFPEINDKDPKSHFDWLLGFIERFIFTIFVAAAPNNAPVLMGGWIALKIATGWNKRKDYEDKKISMEDSKQISLLTRLFSLNAILGSLISLFFAFCGGIITNYGWKLLIKKMGELNILEYIKSFL